MDAVDTLRQEVRQGRISADQLVDVIASLQRQLQAAKERIAALEKRLGDPPPTAKLTEPFSVRSEEQRQEARGNKCQAKRTGRRGRFQTKDKIAQAERTEAVYPEGVPPEECQLSHTRPVWRLENNRAVLVAYQVYCGPKKHYGKIPGVLGRSEFGLEIVTEIAFLVYIVGLSFDKVCLLLKFFQNLNLRKSQTDALLYQLARHWEHEFEALCTLLAHALVVHADETSWSLNSVWAFLSEKARVLLFGVHKDADTLKQLLDPQTFAGIVFSDDAAVYEHFGAAQKCWAHLLRKAIKLTLQDPNNVAYRTFTDRLFEIYHEACRVHRDQRLGDAGRARKVAALDDDIFDLCAALWFADLRPLQGLDHDYRLLVNEVMRLALAKELFTFVAVKPVEQPNGITQPVDGTNNEAERTLRGAAQARLMGRTNKTLVGARRQTILTTVLESLRLYLENFTLASVIDEMKRWWATGQSCFTKLLKQRKLTLPKQSILDRILPNPSG